MYKVFLSEHTQFYSSIINKKKIGDSISYFSLVAIKYNGKINLWMESFLLAHSLEIS